MGFCGTPLTFAWAPPRRQLHRSSAPGRRRGETGLRSPFLSLMRLRPGNHHRVAGAAEMRGNLFRPLEGSAAGMGPADGIIVVGQRTAKLVLELPVGLYRIDDPVEAFGFVVRAGQSALGASAVVADDIDHDRVVELAQLLDRADQPADFVIGVGEESGEHFLHPRIELLGRRRSRSPTRESTPDAVSGSCWRARPPTVFAAQRFLPAPCPSLGRIAP